MKKAILTMTLLALSLTACFKNETREEYAKRVQEEHRMNHSDFAHKLASNRDVTYNTLFKLCIDGVAYLDNGHGLIVERSAEDKPIACMVDKDENE